MPYFQLFALCYHCTHLQVSSNIKTHSLFTHISLPKNLSSHSPLPSSWTISSCDNSLCILSHFKQNLIMHQSDTRQQCCQHFSKQNRITLQKQPLRAISLTRLNLWLKDQIFYNRSSHTAFLGRSVFVHQMNTVERCKIHHSNLLWLHMTIWFLKPKI